MVPFLLLAAGLVALVAGAELLVRGAARLAAACGLSSLVIGLTVVAFGTSTPELAVSVSSAFLGKAEIAVGNVVGSNIYNVLFILGLSALILPLAVDQKLIRFDVPLMIGVSLLMWLLGWDGAIQRWEGCLLFLGLLLYTAWCIAAGRNESPQVKQEHDEFLHVNEAEDTSRQGKAKGFVWQICLIVAGLALLVLGGNWLVSGAAEIARYFGMSELLIGLTVVAIGTSLPELATSVVAAIRGERDIAVGNVVGSNLFNILGVLGLSAIVAPEGIAVANQALQFDIPVMIAVAAACLPLFFTGYLIARWEGALFLGCSVGYTVSVILMAFGNNAFP